MWLFKIIKAGSKVSIELLTQWEYELHLKYTISMYPEIEKCN